MKDFLEWLDNHGIFDLFLEVGLGLFCLISLVRCSLE